MLCKMASSSLVSPVVVASYLLLFIFSSFPQASSLLNEDDLEVSNLVSPRKVDVSVYYDSLCPHCAKFIVQKLESVFENDLISIINLRLVPWGNAYINNSEDTIACQHGPDECLLNTIEACAIDQWPDVNTHFGLIYCIEFLAAEGKHKEWETCFKSLDLPRKKTLDCYTNGKGIKIELGYGNETARLNPPLTFVPWVVVNNQPVRDDYENFASYICKVYKGSPVPRACKSPPPKINSSRNSNMILPVCYATETQTLASSIPAKDMLT
ncbi:hypothetical protein SLE2022_105800 [Rubroshorea leprosula]